jgi:5-(carboxyamino)imidazole ribonucleotide mutase
MGSDSDLEHFKGALSTLEAFQIPFEVRVISAHRAPQRLHDYVKSAPGRGVKIFIAGAGGAAHLPGVIASLTTRPVIGVPVPTSTTASIDSILSILQMPAGVPVATMSAGSGGPTNAAILAVQILAVSDEALAKRLDAYKEELVEKNAKKDERVQKQFRQDKS